MRKIKTTTASVDYQERVSYDANGNITKYKRNKDAGITQDSLNYKYNTGTNQLQYITDNVANNVSTTDIDNQSPNNYIYDKSGNMVADSAQSMSVSWSPYGKILTNTKAGGANLSFGYNAMQQRVLKRVVLAGDTTRTYYIRDAQGNTMGVYTRHNDSVSWREQYIFGSSRLGLYRADTLVNKGLQTISKLYEGKRNYELTNHLGNVLAVINDRKTDSLSATNVKLGYNAVVIATDYFPFGMAIDSRSYSAKTYRYGFNDKENDSETGYQDYGMRMYDGKNPHFLSIDPLTKKYPFYSPYIFAGDNPIMAIDLDGAEPLQKVKDNQYETPDVLANYGDYHKTGHNYFAIKASADMYWYIRVSATATTYGDKTFEYWDGKSYSPYIPNGYYDQKEAYKSVCQGTGEFGLKVEAITTNTINIGITLYSGGVYSEVTGTAWLATGFRGITASQLAVKGTSALADAGTQVYFSDKKTFSDKLGDINVLSPASQFIFSHPTTSAIGSSLFSLNFNDATSGEGMKKFEENSVFGNTVKASTSILYGSLGNMYTGATMEGLKFDPRLTGHSKEIVAPFLNLYSNFNTNVQSTNTSKKISNDTEPKK